MEEVKDKNLMKLLKKMELENMARRWEVMKCMVFFVIGLLCSAIILYMYLNLWQGILVVLCGVGIMVKAESMMEKAKSKRMYDFIEKNKEYFIEHKIG